MSDNRTAIFNQGRGKQHGAALLIMLVILVVGAAAVLVSSLNSSALKINRDKITADALAQAKEALIGFAATYRDTHPSSGSVYDKMFGYLPCPAIDGNGVAGNCGAKDVTLIGLLPWKTLGLPTLRDSSGECLWYAVSGRFKNTPKTDVLNWDTAGQLIVNDAGGALLANGIAAVIFSPRNVIGNQNRTPAGTTECGGNTTVAAYLDGGDPIYAGTAPIAGANTTLTVATTSSLATGINNDRALWIAPTEIFDRIKRRSDFVTDITNLLSDIRDQAGVTNPVTCAVGAYRAPDAVITDPGTLGKSIGLAPTTIQKTCISADATLRKAVFDNWHNNVLYAVCPGGVPCLTVNGINCTGAAIFSGEKASGSTRPSTNAVDYLEGANLSAFTTVSTNITGTGPYSFTASSGDIAICIP
jgi:type II secretory pathway pseudopilin PulG